MSAPVKEQAKNRRHPSALALTVFFGQANDRNKRGSNTSLGLEVNYAKQ
jgi:hypothetical protein